MPRSVRCWDRPGGSSHWTPGSRRRGRDPVATPDAFVEYIRQNFPSPAGHKIYFDHGTRTLDAYYAPTRQRVDRMLQAKGWTGGYFESRVFPGNEHNEKYWGARLSIPLTFLLAPALNLRKPGNALYRRPGAGRGPSQLVSPC